jgi:hypothetical protein
MAGVKKCLAFFFGVYRQLHTPKLIELGTNCLRLTTVQQIVFGYVI